MQINFLSKKKSKIHRITKTKVREFINPAREWTIGLAVALVVLGSGGTYIGIDLHTQFTKEQVFTELTESSFTYDKGAVVEFASRYREKEKVFNELRESRPKVVVPIVEETLSETQEDAPVMPEEVATSSESVVLE